MQMNKLFGNRVGTELIASVLPIRPVDQDAINSVPTRLPCSFFKVHNRFLRTPMHHITNGDDDHQREQDSHPDEINNTFSLWFELLTAAQ